MISKYRRLIVKRLIIVCALLVACVGVAGMTLASLQAQKGNGLALGNGHKDPTPTGSWMGIARPCPPPPGDTSPDHALLCSTVCGLCPLLSGALPPEEVLQVTLHDDGTLIASDSPELGIFHTTANGAWEASDNDGLPAWLTTQRFKGTYLYLGQNFLGSNKLDNSVRTRLVTYLDPNNANQMLGYIQPHFFTPFPPGFTTGGIVNVIPASPTDTFSSNHIPVVDPLPPLPAGCTVPPAGSCLGTYHFVIRRIQAQ